MLAGSKTLLVDVSDLSFQASPEYAPKHEQNWKFPKEQDGWFHAHNSIRAELAAIKDCLAILTKNPITSSQVAAFKSMWNAHTLWIHEHHTTEDKLLAPWIASRVKLPEKMFAAHDDLETLISKMTEQVDTLGPGSDMSIIRDLCESYESMMLPHLHEEEAVAVPLMRAYFSQAEASKKVAAIMAKVDPRTMGNVGYWMEENDSVFSFMAQEGIPCFVYYLVFKPKINQYKTSFIIPCKAIREGHDWEEPKKTSRCAIM